MLYILVADEREAQIYGCKLATNRTPLAGNPVHRHYDETQEIKINPILKSPLTAEPVSDYEIGRNKVATVFQSASSDRSSSGPKEDVQTHIKHIFIKEIAKKLSELDLEHLVLVSSPRIIKELKEHLNKSLLNKIAAEVPKSLAHCTENELISHLEPELRKLIAKQN